MTNKILSLIIPVFISYVLYSKLEAPIWFVLGYFLLHSDLITIRARQVDIMYTLNIRVD